MASPRDLGPSAMTSEQRREAFLVYTDPENVNLRDKLKPRAEYPGMCFNFLPEARIALGYCS